MMSNKVYDVLKKIALVILPPIATFYSAMAVIWGWPYGEEVVGTIVAVETLLGAWLQISTTKYNKTVPTTEEPTI
jgi:hypothetical protein